MSRPGVLALVLLVAAASLATPAAGADGVLLTDGTGDVLVTSTQASAPAPIPENAQTAGADLVELAVVETDLDFAFTLKVAALGQQGGSTNRYLMDLTWMDATFRVDVFRSRIDPTSEPLTAATLSLCSDECVRVTDLEHEIDEGAGTVSFLVPKRYITSLEGHAPVFGSELTDVVVRSLVSLDGFPGLPATGARAEDVMPDTGAGTIKYEKGGSANGHIVLEAPDPVRVSNGGATTFVFNCHVQNALAEEDTVTFTLEGVPPEWSATAPGPQTVPGQSEKPVFVLATIPFGHQHGGFSTFNLTATSAKDPSIKASIRFGVLHTPVPMPAGHHSEIYLHARPGDTGVFQTALPRTDVTMSTVAEHGEDVAEALASTFDGVSWRIPLAPQLAIGVDMDMARTGMLSASVHGHMDVQATMRGELWLVKGDQEIALMGTLADAQVALTQNAPTSFTSVFTPEPASDYAPYSAGQNLELRFTLTPEGGAPCCNPQSPPSLVVSDFKLVLPLNEYADAPSFEEGEGSSIRLDPQGALERSARPGTTVTYGFLLSSLRPEGGEYAIEIAGTHAKASETAPAGTIALGPEPTLVTLAVHVPGDAGNDERLESILVVRSKADPSDLAIARTATLVSQAAATEDEGAKFDEAKNGARTTPGIPPAGLLLALGLTLLIARRDRR